MRPVRLIWQLYPSYLAVLFVSLLGVGWYFSHSLHHFYLGQTAGDLESRARLIAPQLAGRLAPEGGASLAPFCSELGRAADSRVTVILPGGAVLCDSEEDPARMDNHGGRLEVAAALAGETGVASRYSQTLLREMMYVAVPVREGARIVGVVRTARAVNVIDRALGTISLKIGLAGVAAALLAALLSWWIARRISLPIEELRRGAQRFARGELGIRLSFSGPEELRALAEAMNQMAAQLDERLSTVLRQRNEQDAVLASMVEGVLAVDCDERILRINGSAAELVGVRPGTAEGRPIQEAVRKADLHRFVRRALQAEEPVEGDIVLVSGGVERFLQAHGTRLRDSRGEKIGALIVLNDVTRLRRLENLRRDFVANVSHELKTPITAIKGAAETLEDGALDEPAGARRFVAMIAKQADRLHAIIDDLLALSRIEQGSEREGIPLNSQALRPVLEAAIQDCALAAADKGLGINLFCSSELQSRINAPLLEQAVVNLLTNAIKYSPERGTVAVDAALEEGRLLIRVQDWGCGIASAHLPRLFERFYRVDRARSRNLGGTGLGLAIVKHIVQAHDGEVLVHSTVGAGSTFTIVLPQEEEISGGKQASP